MVVLEIAVGVALVLLFLDNRALRRRVAVVAAGACHKLIAGDQLSSVSATNLSGAPVALDFRQGRFVVAIVAAGCSSCTEVIRQAQDSPGVRILSVADQSQTMTTLGTSPAAPRTYVVNLRDSHGPKLVGSAPEVVVIENGKVVRTCTTVRECV